MYPEKLDESVLLMSLPARGLLFTCLNYSWRFSGLPSDEEAIRAVLGIETEEFKGAWPSVKVHFKPDVHGRLKNADQEKVRQAKLERSQRRAKAANARWHPQQVHS